MKKHANLSIFVPHAGCPHKCSFCDQRAISGTNAPPSTEDITRLCDEYLPKAGKGEGVQIAFFGGSFTAIEQVYRDSLLAAAYPFVKAGRAAGIRISTRPDAIDADILRILAQYGTKSIELGAQSMDDNILRLNERGHSAKDVQNACAMIKQAGFELGVQMMPGLYGESDYRKGAIDTAKRLIDLEPDTVRIYPAITLDNTRLSQLYAAREYQPLTLSEAVDISAELIELFEMAKVRIIRTGLAADASLEAHIVAGPYHPAFNQLCLSKLYCDAILKSLAPRGKGEYNVNVSCANLSTAIGQRQSNIANFLVQGYSVNIRQDPQLEGRSFTIEKVKK